MTTTKLFTPGMRLAQSMSDVCATINRTLKSWAEDELLLYGYGDPVLGASYDHLHGTITFRALDEGGMLPSTTTVVMVNESTPWEILTSAITTAHQRFIGKVFRHYRRHADEAARVQQWSKTYHRDRWVVLT